MAKLPAVFARREEKPAYFHCLLFVHHPFGEARNPLITFEKVKEDEDEGGEEEKEKRLGA